MIPQEFLKNFGNMNLKDSDMNQAEHIWKMLDNMADSNFEEYKQFVSKHVTQGLQEINKEKEEKIKQKKITPKEGLLIKFRGNLKEFQIKEEDEKRDFLQNLLIKNENNGKAKFVAFEKEAKFYLNICYSDKIISAFDFKENLVKDFSNPNSIARIPFSLTDAKCKNNTYFFDLILNEIVYKELIIKSSINKMSTINYLLECFQDRIKKHKNPILEAQIENKQAKLNAIRFYEMDKKSIILHPSKQYKSVQNKFPEPVLPEDGTTTEDYFEKKKKSEILSKKKEIITSDPGINIEETLTKKQNLPSNLTNESKKHKPLIQEIEEENKGKLNKPAYQSVNQKDSYEIEIILPKISKFSEIELNISNSELKLKTATDELNLSFDSKVDNNSVQAKWLSKSKKLKIVLRKI